MTMMGTIKKTGRSIEKAITGKAAAPAGDMDILDKLKEEHEEAAEPEHKRDAHQVHEPDALVVDRGHPAPDACGLVQVILL